MHSLAAVSIHASQFPDRVRRDLIESLRTRRVNHKFHYDSVKQTQKWLALHQVYSPSRTDADCAATYDRSFEAVAARWPSRQPAHVVGLGCGGGQKDARLLRLLSEGGRFVSYTPADVSTAMVLTARATASQAIPLERCSPLVCDLATTSDLPTVLDAVTAAGAARLITFFGMVPNFEPQMILRRLAELVRPGDFVLCSANLAPGPNYAAGVRQVLPQYDNAATREWLLTFLLDLGVAEGDGELQFAIEDDPEPTGLKRITCDFIFRRTRCLAVEDEKFEFAEGERIRLFFSYRHTPSGMQKLLAQEHLAVSAQWVTASEEEGVFLATRDRA